MLIDFHTHIFPDALAPKAMSGLKKHWVNQPIEPVTDGTKTSLLAEMDRCGVDISVIAQIATKPSQTEAGCKFAQEIADDRIIPFGSISPRSDDFRKDIDLVVSYGLKGIKLHAQYQNFIVNDPLMLKIYDYAFNKGLIILQHSGYDIAYKPPYNATPAMFRDVANHMRGGTMVAAHLGGMAMWDEVLDLLCGTNIYLDTSQGVDYYTKKQFTDIVNAHGADKILFATDSPWGSAERERKGILSCGFTEEQENMIFSGNAKRLLSL